MTPGCEHDFDPECARCQTFDHVPDGWAKIDGKWVRVEKCDTDCSEHYDGRHLSADRRLW